MNVLLIGSGGREHALAWKIAQSKKLKKLYIAPGNAGTTEVGENTALSITDFESIGKFSLEKNIDIIIVGPEEPLVKGIYDFFKKNKKYSHIPLIGPSLNGAQLEGSKKFAKEFMQRHNIPTAKYHSVTKETLNDGLNYLQKMNPPYVLKANGLAAGKGVLILNSREKAEKELKLMLGGKFGEASNLVVIEEFLKGIELSIFVITDSDSYKILPEAKDYKRIGEGDTGLNTGGMGCISPVPFANTEFLKKVKDRIVIPTINGLKKDNIVYTGFIFIGLMNIDGEPYVVEYNVRMGDPEAEVIIPRLDCDLLDIFEAVANKNLSSKNISINPKSCATVMLVSGGYPGNYEKGKEIKNLEQVTNSILFHAGTKTENNKILTNGGRVIAVSSFGNNFKQALEQSYLNAKVIDFDKKYYRKDIGFDL